ITTGKDDKGLKIYDPGYLNTAPVRSSICYIDGDEGILRYRGYPIEELAESSSFVEVAYLLMYGNLPTQSQLAGWEFAISQHSAVPQGLLDIIQSMPHDAHPMGVLASAMSTLSVFHPDANPALQGQDLYKSKQVRDKQIVRVLGKAPTIAAAAYLRLAGRPPVLPLNTLSYSENFLYMLDSLGDRTYKPNPRLARALDILFILHAEHEMNCSTAAVRHLASSGVDVFTALSGGVGALYGPLHGGANEAVLKMLNEIGSMENIPDFIVGVKNRKRKMSGFGHRVYKNYDPRAKVIRKLADEVFSIVGRDPLIEVAIALEKAALSDEYFIKRKLYPNVDFYSGLIYRAMGFPTEFFPNENIYALPFVVRSSTRIAVGVFAKYIVEAKFIITIEIIVIDWVYMGFVLKIEDQLFQISMKVFEIDELGTLDWLDCAGRVGTMCFRNSDIVVKLLNFIWLSQVRVCAYFSGLGLVLSYERFIRIKQKVN
ncbi:hypothetical protein ACJX0J_025331, partial [Zea mays]